MRGLLLISASIAAVVFATGAAAQSNKAIMTGGAKGAYHTQFCPPVPKALEKAFFSGYQCVASGGTGDNIKGVVETPSRVGFVQLDVFARQAAADPALGSAVTVVRSDIACEGLWMVTKNDRLQSYGDVLGYARRIDFLLPPKSSGSTASFEFLQSLDPQGLGRATSIKHLDSATDVIKAAAASNSVGFFVQFADPENANIKLLSELGLHAIPVVSREIIRAKVGDNDLYSVQSFDLTAGGIFTKSTTATTACTPVAIITGTPAASPQGDDQRDLVTRLRGSGARKPQ